MRVLVGRMALGCGIGVTASGIRAGGVCALLAAASLPIERARARARAREKLDEQLVAMLRSIAATTRAGCNLAQALGVAREEVGPPLDRALERCLARVSVGAPLDEALELLASEGAAADDAVETMKIARTAGTHLPDVLEETATAMAERARIARDKRAATAQARMSATIVGTMPLAFYALLGRGARGQLEMLLTTRAGWAMLAAGAILEAAGLWWVRALCRPA